MKSPVRGLRQEIGVVLGIPSYNGNLEEIPEDRVAAVANHLDELTLT